MSSYLNKREEHSDSTESLCQLAEIILKHNYFENGTEIYHQLLGTAIGTKFPPNYANLLMAGIEDKIFQQSLTKPYLWLRYLEDIFCIWTEGVEKLHEFYAFLNSFHPTIKFTIDFSEDRINILDVIVIKNGNQLKTDLYTKKNRYTSISTCPVMP